MEPMVIFSVAIVIYCGCITCLDVLRDMERERRRAIRIARVARNKTCHGRSRAAATSSSRMRANLTIEMMELATN